jgi:iron complex transport system substrate-binding protein
LDDQEPFVGSCCGSFNLIIESAGAKNIFDDMGVEPKKSWENVAWDKVEELNPGLIVLVDASWDMAGKRVYFSSLALFVCLLVVLVG